MTGIQPEHRERQLKAIEIQLATAPKIQDDLEAKFGYGENMFFYNDLMEYRITKSLPKIAEDLDLEERYDLINDQPRNSVGRAFRGYNGKDFPKHKFDGLFGKVTNDYIQEIREIKGSRKGGRKIADMINPETGVGYLVEARRKSIEARGAFSWRDNLEYVLEIGELKYEKGLTWKETTTVMNEKYDKDWATATVRMAYQSNKDLLPDEEE